MRGCSLAQGTLVTHRTLSLPSNVTLARYYPQVASVSSMEGGNEVPTSSCFQGKHCAWHIVTAGVIRCCPL